MRMPVTGGGGRFPRRFRRSRARWLAALRHAARNAAPAGGGSGFTSPIARCPLPGGLVVLLPDPGRGQLRVVLPVLERGTQERRDRLHVGAGHGVIDGVAREPLDEGDLVGVVT